MSNLNAGGSRQRARRIFGAENIKRHIQRGKPDHSSDADTSIADRPHQHSREVARRLRQEARRKP